MGAQERGRHVRNLRGNRGLKHLAPHLLTQLISRRSVDLVDFPWENRHFAAVAHGGLLLPKTRLGMAVEEALVEKYLSPTLALQKVRAHYSVGFYF